MWHWGQDEGCPIPYMDKVHPLMVLKGDNCMCCVIHVGADPTVGLALAESGLENPTNSGPPSPRQ